jgi:hypothetical protein
MRKHRLLGVVVIAVLIGLGAFTQTSTTAHATGTGRAGIQLASADLAAGRLIAARHLTVDSAVSYPSPGVLPGLVAGRARALVTGPFGPEALAWYVAVSLEENRAATGAYLTDVARFQAATKAYLQAVAPPRPAPTPVGRTPAAATSPAVGDPWAALRRCESGGNYGADTGNGYYGAYQFTLGTWASLGFRGLPSQASPGQQDQAAQELEARRGWSQWPSCARRLGLL